MNTEATLVLFEVLWDAKELHIGLLIYVTEKWGFCYTTFEGFRNSDWCVLFSEYRGCSDVTVYLTFCIWKDGILFFQEVFMSLYNVPNSVKSTVQMENQIERAICSLLIDFQRLLSWKAISIFWNPERFYFRRAL